LSWGAVQVCECGRRSGTVVPRELGSVCRRRRQASGVASGASLAGGDRGDVCERPIAAPGVPHPGKAIALIAQEPWLW